MSWYKQLGGKSLRLSHRKSIVIISRVNKVDNTPKAPTNLKERSDFFQNEYPAMERRLEEGLDPLGIGRDCKKPIASGVSARVCHRSGNNQQVVQLCHDEGKVNGRERSTDGEMREGGGKMGGAGEGIGMRSGGFIGKERGRFSLENYDSLSREFSR
ncbi:hypothetical protein Cgig2_020593 [Carnegiea gigantea]|uniref:Uncharacterized protein n=1 Tax=Carnegiea gigantea TaxID=171969 RepID=A0A9Q1JYE5_9CARY|nr:hypothetical protein Cgig2_020593 [Carnegiea gigantea]